MSTVTADQSKPEDQNSSQNLIQIIGVTTYPAHGPGIFGVLAALQGFQYSRPCSSCPECFATEFGYHTLAIA
uniref:Uncharacterized protein n=1 Tax=Romanomermis culicivorax TaxID=13658 RepID=A0A915KNJ3_ROMCU